MAVVVLMAGINCVCVNAMSASASVAQMVPAKLAAKHACCDKGQNGVQPQSKPFKYRDSQCPHCAGSVTVAVIEKHAAVSLPHELDVLYGMRGNVSVLTSPSISRISILNPAPWSPPVTLLDLSCLLTT